MSEHPPKVSGLIGRWQPLHEGHRALIQSVLDEGRAVVVIIMDTPASDRNPYSVETRDRMIIEAFPKEVQAGTLTTAVIPWIDEVCFGRDCGWGVRQIHLSEELEAITATEIREGTWESK